MNSSAADCRLVENYELRFLSLFKAGRGYAFPCDAEGHVDLDGLSEVARANYFYARGSVGRDLSMPERCVRPA